MVLQIKQKRREMNTPLTKKILFILLISIFACDIHHAYGQYFVSEVDPCYLRWRKIEDKKKGDILFPDYILDKALRISFYRDTLSGVIDYNIPFKKRRFPVTLHPTNMMSNGMVTYTPQRMELYTMPDRNNFSLPWSKQLIAHEYRHVAQLSNLNQGITKALSYVIGEQMLGLTAVLVPSYFYEGDAVVAETQFSMWGRGKQPTFNIALRAEAEENTNFKPIKYRMGTLNEYTPDSYLLGYYITQYMTQHYGEDIWSKILRFAARNPYFIDPTFFAYRKYANKMSSTKIIDSTMNQMRNFWKEASSVPNSSTLIDTKVKSYTKYSHPLPLNDSLVLVHKSDMDRAGRFVVLNINTAEERFIHNSGNLSANPIITGNNIYWGEIVPSLSWGQKNSSEIFTMKMSEDYQFSRPRKVKQNKENLFFISPYENGGFVGVSYDKMNEPHLVLMDDKFRKLKDFSVLGNDISFNGLSYDNITKRIYMAIVDDRGTSIAWYDFEKHQQVDLMPANYGTITNLTANDGKLYYSSIDSGKDEMHVYDLLEKKEYQITTSKYGSEASVPMSLWSNKKKINSNKVLLTTYTKNGYGVATQEVKDVSELKEREWRKIPESVVNYPFKEWNVAKLDTINISKEGFENYAESKKVKKYNKTLNSVNVHGWIPFYVDIDKIIDDRQLSGGWGLNILSQNLMNSVIAYASYGRVNGENIFKANLKYTGLPVHLDFDVEYGGGKQLTYNYIQIGGELDNYLNLEGGLSLPFNFSSGANNRFFKASVSYEYNNSLLYKKNKNATIYNLSSTPVFLPMTYNSGYKIKEGISKAGVQLTYQNTLKSTLKDLNPRLGYLVQLNAAFNPTRDDFGKVYSIYGRGYLPGPFPHGSFVLETSFQYQTKGDFNYAQSILFPRGADYYSPITKMYAGALEYKVPLLYPCFGIGSFLHFQRISAGAFADYATFETVNNSKMDNRNSFGLLLIFDVNLFGIKNLFNIELSGYKPSDKQNFMVGASLKLAL